VGNLPGIRIPGLARLLDCKLDLGEAAAGVDHGDIVPVIDDAERSRRKKRAGEAQTATAGPQCGNQES